MGDDRPTLRLHRLPPRGRQWVTIALVAVIVALLGWIVLDNRRSGRQAELAASNAAAIAEEVRDACARQGDVARELGDLCRQAEQVAEEPAEPAARAPTDEQLRPIVQRYVAEWLTANPPRDGRDGRTPTTAEISALITAELAANPPPSGQDGRTPTAADIRPIVVEEVAAFFAANPPPPGEDGADGQDGADGAAGADGAPGVDGEDGQPPLSWNQPCPSLLDPDRRCVCERDPESPDDAPTYTCNPEPEEPGG